MYFLFQRSQKSYSCKFPIVLQVNIKKQNVHCLRYLLFDTDIYQPGGKYVGDISSGSKQADEISH